MRLLRYDSIRNICLVCQRVGNVYRLIEVSASELFVRKFEKAASELIYQQLRGEG